MTKQLTTINPTTEEVINTYDIATKEQINEKTIMWNEMITGTPYCRIPTSSKMQLACLVIKLRMS